MALAFLSVCLPVRSNLRSLRVAARLIAFALLAFVAPRAWATPAATTTTLSVTAGGSPVLTVQTGNAILLTATVKAGSTTLTNGIVLFCNAASANCTDSNLLGTTQITSAGTATYRLFPTPGSHYYSAIFLPQTSYGGSTSSVSTLAVTGGRSVTATLSSSGTAGNYALLGKIQGSIAPSPTATLTFQDASNGNVSLGTAPLGSYTSTYAPTQTNPAVDAGPQIMAVGDFNRDGYPDMLVGNYGSGNMSILLNNRNGTFATSTFTFNESTAVPSAFAVADFNGDGKLDVAVLSYFVGVTNQYVTILLGNGAGGFTEQTTLLPLTGTPENVAAGDFNGDGIVDLVVANYATNQVQIWLGHGDGTFAAQTPMTVPSSPVWVTVADLNGDGKADLVIPLGAGGVGIYLGSGNGTFTAGATLPGFLYANYVVVGDYNGDGKADLAVADYGGSSVLVFLGDGSGGFTAGQAVSLPGAQPYSLALGDFNGDGITDLAVADFNGTVPVLLGDGNGRFTEAASPASIGSYVYSVVAGDLNQNGLSDWAAISYLNSTATVGVSPTSTTGSASGTLSGVSLPGGGTVKVAVNYSGDATYSGVTSPQISLTGSPIATGISVTAAPAIGSYYGQHVVLSATLSPYNDGSLTTNGDLVTFYSGGMSLGTGALAAGVASLNTTALATGTDTLTAKFAGDTNFITSTSVGLPYYVAAQAPLVLSGTAANTAIGNFNGMTLTVTNLSGSTALSALQLTVTLPSGLNGAQPTVSSNTCGGTVTYPTAPANYSPTLSGGSVSAAGSCQLVLTKILGSALGLQSFSAGLSASGGFTATASGSTTVVPGVWISNGNGTLSEFTTAGTAVSPAGGYTGNGNPATGVAINKFGNIYSLNSGGSMLAEFVPSGTGGVQSTVGQAGLANPAGLGVDGTNLVWVVNGNGSLSAFSPPTATRSGPSNSAATSGGGIALDRSGNIWVTNPANNRVTEFLGAGGPTQPLSVAVAAGTPGMRP